MKKIVVLLLLIGVFHQAQAQQYQVNTEAHKYKLLDGHIVLPLTINGVEADFLLDLIGNTSLLPDFAKKIGIKDSTQTSDADFSPYRQLTAPFKCSIQSIALGNNVFSNGISAMLLQGKSAEYIRKLGVVGIVSGVLFRNVVLTFDKRGTQILTSTPFRPNFMRLSERMDCEILYGRAPEFELGISGRKLKVIFDSWQPDALLLNSENILPAHKTKTIPPRISAARYGEDLKVTKGFSGLKVSIANVSIPDQQVPINPNLMKPVAGLGILDHGVLSIDFEKGKMYFQSYNGTVVKESEKPTLTKIQPGKLNAITKDDFIENIFDYKSGNEFRLKGDKPVVIDFWASWCGPCMRLLPTMEKLAEKYKDQIIFYKVNADLEKELSSRFNVTALPTMLFVAPGKKPVVEIGDQPAKIISLIENMLSK